MFNILLGAPLVGILTAFASVVVEQFLAIAVNIIFQKEIVLDVYTHLSFFLVASTIIEESLKYFSAVFVLRRYLNLRRFRFIAAALIAGLFFGAMEIYFILLANGKGIRDVSNLDGNIFFSLSAIGLLHILTFFLISSFIASWGKETGFQAVKIIVPPVFIHLFFNFLVIQKGDFTNWLLGIFLGIIFIINLFIIAFDFCKLD